ncbi:hypothetical protein FAVG1_09860 [Fusarium avenaceum]|nr:hypothetical protein FAVG1_09860 [Fusarium avenaceum]
MSDEPSYKEVKGSGQDPMKGVTTGEDTAIPSAPASGSTLGPAKGQQDSVSNVSKPVVSVETLTGEMKLGETVEESVKTLWKQYRGANAIIGPVVAPFTVKLETFIPDAMVTEHDVGKMNELLWCCEVVYRRAERLLSVQFTAGYGPGPLRSRAEFLQTWSVIKFWLKKVYAMSPIPLNEYFRYTRMFGINIEGHLDGLDELLVQKIQIDEDYGAAQETLARSLAMRNEVSIEVKNLIASDFDETGRALSQWIHSRPADERLICARFATWDLIRECDVALIKRIDQWGSIEIAKHSNSSADEVDIW